MKRRGMSLREKREYAQLQERKKRQLERRNAKEYGYDEDEKFEEIDFYDEEDIGFDYEISHEKKWEKKGREKRDEKRGERRVEKRKKRHILSGIHAIMSAAFMGMVLILNVLPLKYLAVLALILFILWGIGYLANGRRRKGSSGARAYIIFMILILGAGTFYAGKLSGALDMIASDSGFVDFKMKSEPFSVYVSGIDVYGDITKKSRSDVNIIATVNPKTHQILLVTTPRDYYVEIPGISGGQKDKLTHAGLYGVEASMKTLEALYDVKVPFYARVNFTSLIDIVDKLGGIDVNSEYEFTTGEAAGEIVHVSQGMNHFNGKQALAFSRERHNLADGDNQRGKNQQAVITGMIKKMVSPAMLIKASGIIDSVSGNIETNMSQRQLQTLIKMQLSKGGSWQVCSVAAEGTGARNACYSSGSSLLYVTKPDYQSVEKIKAMIDQVENGEMLEGSETTE